MSHYETLGVNGNASLSEIKRGYRVLAGKWHPDRNHDPDAKDRFTEVRSAYECLSDADKRAYYDEHGTEPLDQLEEKAKALLLEQFIQVAKSNNWRSGAYIGQIRENIQARIGKSKATIKEINETLDRLDELLPELPEGETENVFAGALHHVRDMCDKDLTAIQNDLTVFSRALEIIAPYRDRQQINPQQIVNFGFVTSSTATV